MTLLVGVLCSNGAVIATDRQATHAAMGQPTVAQSVTKVRLINGEALYASSGPVGLGQQLGAIVESKQQEFKNQRYDAYVTKLQEALRPLVNSALNTAGFAARDKWSRYLPRPRLGASRRLGRRHRGQAPQFQFPVVPMARSSCNSYSWNSSSWRLRGRGSSTLSVLVMLAGRPLRTRTRSER